MRKTLLLLLLLAALSTNAQMRVYPASLDPYRTDFCLYWNDALSVRMFSMQDMSKADVFGKDIRSVLRTEDSIYFALFRDRYTVWLPEYNLIFKVEPTYNKAVHLGDHLIAMIGILRDYRRSQCHMITSTN